MATPTSEFLEARLYRRRGELTECTEPPLLLLTDQARGTMPSKDRMGTLEIPWYAWFQVSNYTGCAADPRPYNQLVMDNQLVLEVHGQGTINIERVGPPHPWIDRRMTGTFDYKIME